jgi:hypothetical protein
MQHSMFDEVAVLNSVATAALKAKPVLVRVLVNAAGLMSQVLDFGVAGVICLMVNNKTDADTLVSYTKFALVGARSWGPRRALPISGLSAPDYLAKANHLIVTFAMIKMQEALDNLDDILGVSGIGGVFVGAMSERDCLTVFVPNEAVAQEVLDFSQVLHIELLRQVLFELTDYSQLRSSDNVVINMNPSRLVRGREGFRYVAFL